MRAFLADNGPTHHVRYDAVGAHVQWQLGQLAVAHGTRRPRGTLRERDAQQEHLHGGGM